MTDWRKTILGALAALSVTGWLFAADAEAPAPAGAKASQSTAPAPAATPAAEPVAAPKVDLANATPLPQGVDANTDNIEAVSERVDGLKKKISGLEGKLSEKTRQIQSLLESYNKAEKNLTGFNGLGRIEQMELKAELYAGERMARKKIGEEFSTLAALMEDWDSSKRKLGEDVRLLALKRQILDLKSGSEERTLAVGAPSGNPAKKLTEIEYYQVKKDADLRTISAYPDVYGTPDFWEFLYKANKDKIPDPTKAVPAGTMLVVPQDVKRLPDFSDL